MTTSTGLHALRRGEPSPIPRPPSRWRTRILIPAIILFAALALLAYAARDTFRPGVLVHVAPVVSRPIDAGSGGAVTAQSGTTMVQAPGWIEADPYAINVPALVEGVVEDVLVLDGDRVEAGQPVARLINADTRLAHDRVQAELATLAAGIERARATAAAELASLRELEDELARKTSLESSDAVSPWETAKLKLRLDFQRAMVDSAQAAIQEAQAAHGRCEVMCDEAALAMERTTVLAPVAGVVLQRLVQPGSRISLSDAQGATDGTMGVVARMYDPERLQVRVDVPLADAGKVGVGMSAEIETEAVPGRVFKGHVTRVVQEANIQRNTIQAKVAIEDPIETLKPEMLARVRLISGGSTTDEGVTNGDQVLLVPDSALAEVSGEKAVVWVVEQRSGGRGAVAERREVMLGRAKVEGHTQAVSGVRPGDRVVLDPSSEMRAGARLRIEEGGR